MGADPEGAEEEEEEGQWEERERTTTRGHCTGRGDYEYDKYVPPHSESEALSALSNSELLTPFEFGTRYEGLPQRPIGPSYF